MEFFNVEPENYTDKTFGQCVREKRESLGYSVRSMAKMIGMSPIYLSDIERGNRPAPTGVVSKQNYMESMVKVLELSPEEEKAFYMMAEVTAGRLDEFSAYLTRNPTARVALRLAAEANYSDEEWQKVIDLLQSLNE